MKKLLALACVIGMAGACFAQSNLTTRVFTYDATSATNGLSTFEVDDSTVTGTGTAGTDTSNTVSGATVSAANFAVNTTLHIKTYVYINGNFGGTYTVHG